MQNVTIVNFYKLKQYNGKTRPVPTTVQNPVSVIVSHRDSDISDAQITLSEQQYNAVAPEVYSFFKVDNINMIFVVTEIEQTAEDGVLTFTLIGSEITAWYMSRRTATKDRVPGADTALADFTVTLLNSILPIGVIADSTSQYYTTDTNKIISIKVSDNTASTVKKYLHEGDTLLAWLLSNTDNKCLLITSMINPYYDSTNTAVFIYSELTITEPNVATEGEILTGDITTKESDITDYLYKQTLDTYGPQGAYVPYLTQDPATLKTTQKLSYTNTTSLFVNTQGHNPIITAPSLDAVEDNGLNNMTYESFAKYLLSACYNKPNSLAVDNYYYPVTIQQTPETKIYCEEQVISIPAYISVDGTHKGVVLLCASEGAKTTIIDFYNALGSGFGAVDMASQLGSDKVQQGEQSFYAVGVYYYYNASAQNVPVAICNITKDGGVSTYPSSWAETRAYDVKDNLNYCMPLALASYEQKLASGTPKRLTTDITVNTANTDLSLGDVVLINTGLAQKTGFVSSVTETRENGTTTKDYEVTWTS